AGRDGPAASSSPGTTPDRRRSSMSHDAPSRFVEPADIARIALGWGAFGALLLLGPLLEPSVPWPVLVLALAVIVGVIIVCAFGVLKQAEALARRLGDPYGSLVLTLSIVRIEVILIAAVMLGPGRNATIACGSVCARVRPVRLAPPGRAAARRRAQHARCTRPASAGARSHFVGLRPQQQWFFALPRYAFSPPLVWAGSPLDTV